MANLNWLRTELPGELIADGAPFRITHERGEFVLYLNNKKIDNSSVLGYIKYVAQLRADDLQEVGLLELDQ